MTETKFKELKTVVQYNRANLHSEELQNLANEIKNSKSPESVLLAEILEHLALQNLFQLTNTLEFVTAPPELT